MGAQQIRLALDLGVASVQPDDDATTAMDRAKDELELTAKAEAAAARAAEVENAETVGA
jgi:hypothetical protein